MSNPSRTRHNLLAAVIGALALLAGVVGVPSPAGAIPGGWTDVDEVGTTVRPLVFPVDAGDGEVRYADDWLDPRGSGRRHLGTDIVGDKLMPLLAARNGCLTRVDHGGPGGGNYLTLTDADGWQYRYIHVNNDTPGTDDGANPRDWAFADGLDEGDCVVAGDHIAFLGDSGNAEWSGAHLHFEVQRPDGTWINPYHSLVAAERGDGLRSLPPLVRPPRGRICDDTTAPPPRPAAASASGYWLLDGSGQVHTYGDAQHFGDLTSPDPGPGTDDPAEGDGSGDGDPATDDPPTDDPTTGDPTTGDPATGDPATGDPATGDPATGDPAPGDDGASQDASAAGDGSGVASAIAGAAPVGAAAAVSMEATPSGLGYWIVDADGVVHAFGDAPALGDMTGVVLDGPVRRIEAHPGGEGYWLVADDGGVFTYGDARFHGSMGGKPLDAPVISMSATADGEGYWLVAADGGVFTFGSARFHGSTGAMDLWSPVIDMAVHPEGGGYWLYAGDGGVFTFGDTAFHGSGPGLGRCELAPSTSLRVSATGKGYWIANEDGEVLTFGDAAWYGDLPQLAEGATITDMAVRTTVPTTG